MDALIVGEMLCWAMMYLLTLFIASVTLIGTYRLIKLAFQVL